MNQPQKLEVRKDELSNTITTAPKDYMVAILENRDIREYLEYSPTIRANRKGLKVAIKESNTYRLVKDEKDIVDDAEYVFIREMTTLEAFRLMGFNDEDYEKTKKAVNDKFYKGKDRSNTRMYKMAGNSIVVNVCEELFKKLLLDE